MRLSESIVSDGCGTYTLRGICDALDECITGFKEFYGHEWIEFVPFFPNLFSLCTRLSIEIYEERKFLYGRYEVSSAIYAAMIDALFYEDYCVKVCLSADCVMDASGFDEIISRKKWFAIECIEAVEGYFKYFNPSAAADD